MMVEHRLLPWTLQSLLSTSQLATRALACAWLDSLPGPLVCASTDQLIECDAQEMHAGLVPTEMVASEDSCL